MIITGPADTVVEIPQHSPGLECLGDWLEITGTNSLANTFPSVYHPLARSRRFAICDETNGDLLSHVATADAQLSDDSRLKLIGSVATEPTRRGQGLAGKILSAVIQQASDDGFDALLLWSGLDKFYQRFGFEPAGSQLQAPIWARYHELPADQQVRPAAAADLPAILALHQDKPLRIRRDLHQLALSLSARPMTTVVLERDGQVIAYACYQKGADFHNWWHDLGGSDQDIVMLLETALHDARIAKAQVLIPPYRASLCSALHPAAAEPAALRLALTERGAGELFVDGLDSI